HRRVDRLVVSQCSARYVYFFFEAEDGIRDWSVTGVQTCALPIFGGRGAQLAALFRSAGLHDHRMALRHASDIQGTAHLEEPPLRSEERRVGKESRSRGGADP